MKPIESDDITNRLTHNAPLADYSTMRLGGNAAYVLDARRAEDIKAAHHWALQRNLPLRMVGSGSNIVWRDEGFEGLLLVNNIGGFTADKTDDNHTRLTVGSGENWDSVVARSVKLGLTGIEALSLVPGSSGATPVQNVGAYGQDISQTLVSLEAYDTQSQQLITIPAADCQFGYRTSRFKTNDSGRFFITSITLDLTEGNPQPPFYAGVQKYFDEHNVDITTVTPQVLRDAVVAIRQAKLPDPAHIANNGSFFANPIISADEFTHLEQAHPTIAHWPAKQGVKLSAAWLIEQAGFKDYHDPETGMATWPTQPLVLINEHAKNTADLLAFKQKIVDAVAAKFGVTLTQEPELLP